MVRFQEVLPVITTEPTLLIGMHQRILLWLAWPYRHQQGIQHQLSIDA